ARVDVVPGVSGPPGVLARLGRRASWAWPAGSSGPDAVPAAGADCLGASYSPGRSVATSSVVPTAAVAGSPNPSAAAERAPRSGLTWFSRGACPAPQLVQKTSPGTMSDPQLEQVLIRFPP